MLFLILFFNSLLLININVLFCIKVLFLLGKYRIDILKLIIFFVMSFENRILIVLYVYDFLFGWRIFFFDLFYILMSIFVIRVYVKDFVVLFFLKRE